MSRIAIFAAVTVCVLVWAAVSPRPAEARGLYYGHPGAYGYQGYHRRGFGHLKHRYGYQRHPRHFKKRGFGKRRFGHRDFRKRHYRKRQDRRHYGGRHKRPRIYFRLYGNFPVYRNEWRDDRYRSWGSGRAYETEPRYEYRTDPVEEYPEETERYDRNSEAAYTRPDPSEGVPIDQEINNDEATETQGPDGSATDHHRHAHPGTSTWSVTQAGDENGTE